MYVFILVLARRAVIICMSGAADKSTNNHWEKRICQRWPIRGREKNSNRTSDPGTRAASSQVTQQATFTDTSDSHCAPTGVCWSQGWTLRVIPCLWLVRCLRCWTLIGWDGLHDISCRLRQRRGHDLTWYCSPCFSNILIKIKIKSTFNK